VVTQPPTAHAPACVSASVRHHAAVAVALNAFHRQLAFERKTVPFRREEPECIGAPSGP
jgi:hypothetical protein